MKKEFEIVEEDGVVIFDESDDYVPEDDEASEYHLMTNEEIFTDEYMENYARKMDAKIAREKRIQQYISVGLILFIILVTALFIYLFT